MPKKLFSVRRVYGFPAGERGIEQGVSACFAGAIGHRLLMAGGCNFPEVPAADGGKKRFYRGIYAASLVKDDSLNWKKVRRTANRNPLTVSSRYI